MAEFVVTVVRSGGVAGIRRQWRVDVDDSWLAAIDRCPWDATGTRPHPDGFVWQIEVSGERECAATLADADVSGPWRDLVDRVRAAAG